MGRTVSSHRRLFEASEDRGLGPVESLSLTRDAGQIEHRSLMLLKPHRLGVVLAGSPWATGALSSFSRGARNPNYLDESPMQLSVSAIS